VAATDSTAEPPAAQAFYDARRDAYYTKPALRGWLHLLWFEVSLVFSTLLLARAHGAPRITASAIYVASVCGMFGISAACGFDVVVVFAGNVNTTLFYDQSGALVRSTVTGPTFTQSFIAPSTGKSIVSRSPFPVITDYTGGGADGTAAVARATGLTFMLQPGVMFTGRVVFEAVVVGHTPEGSPSSGTPS
jgi:hypothetical protein